MFIMISNILFSLTMSHVLSCLSVEALDIDDNIAVISSLRHKIPERTKEVALPLLKNI